MDSIRCLENEKTFYAHTLQKWKRRKGEREEGRKGEREGGREGGRKGEVRERKEAHVGSNRGKKGSRRGIEREEETVNLKQGEQYYTLSNHKLKELTPLKHFPLQACSNKCTCCITSEFSSTTRGPSLSVM